MEKGGLAHGIGLTKGGRNTKLHAVCDDKGRPLVLLLTSGDVNDCRVAQRCIQTAPPLAHLVADKGYDNQALREWLIERGTQPVIPPRKNREVQYDYDKVIYRQRNIVERLFRRFKDFRRIATCSRSGSSRAPLTRRWWPRLRGRTQFSQQAQVAASKAPEM